MINSEEEYKKIFRNQKRWAKHCTTYSAHRSHSSTQSLIGPAQRTFDYINELDAEKGVSYLDKINKLISFMKNEDEQEEHFKIMKTSFYHGCMQIINKQMKEVMTGIPATIYKMPKG